MPKQTGDVLISQRATAIRDSRGGFCGFDSENLCSVETFSLCCCCCSSASQHIPVYKYPEAPDFLHGNPFVINGYRGKLPLALCLRSLFTWSNDTLNIWSHLIGFWIFFILLIWDNFVELPRRHGSLTDHLVISLGLCCFQFCMLCSTGYHLFRCHSEQANLYWLALDLTGISVGLLGCYLPGIHYGFYCPSVWRDVYFVVIAILFTSVFYWQTRPRYYSPSWFQSRLLLYTALTAYGLVPAVHWVLINGGLQSRVVQMFAPKIVIVYVLGFIAFAFYISKFPERWLPGRFDYIGSSHQCWHVVVVLLFLWWHHSGQLLLDYRLQHPCFT
jgi:predicted membrane channel-forming protein YqfA (hemolysin III family)